MMYCSTDAARAQQKPSNSVDWKSLDSEILSKTNIISECESLGIEFTDSTFLGPGESGKMTCWAFDRPHGNSPSAFVNADTGHYHDSGGVGQNLTFWELAAALKPHSDWRAARKHYADRAGVKLPAGNDANRGNIGTVDAGNSKKESGRDMAVKRPAMTATKRHALLKAQLCKPIAIAKYDEKKPRVFATFVRPYFEKFCNAKPPILDA